MRIHGVRIERFLSFDSFVWDGLDPELNVLVGPNGAGKTNLFHAIRAVRDTVSVNRSSKAPGRKDQRHRGTDETTIEIGLDLEFTQETEQGALSAFIAAAFCNESQISECLQRAQKQLHPDAYRAFSELLSQRLGAAQLPWLFRGRLVARFNGQYWGCWYVSPDGAEPSYYLGIYQTPWGQSVLRGGNGQRSTSLFEAWRSTLSDEDRSILDECLSDPHHSGPCPAPDPTLIPSYASGNAIQLEIRRPSFTIDLPTQRAFEKATGFSLEYTDRYDLRSVLQLLLNRGLVFTDNVRRAPEHLFTQEQINTQSVDLSDGEQLGLALFHLQNGQSDEKQRYSQVQALFSAITKREFDVQVVRPDPSEPAAASNQGNRTRIDLITRSPWGDIPLEYSGAGIAEALFISAVIAGGRGQVVLLDEPASTMHPTMQSTLLQQLENHVGYQFLIATHSAHMVPADLLQQVSRVWLEGGITRRAALDVSKMPPDILRNLKQELRHATEARNLLFQRAVILVEGETEQHAFPVWFDKLGYSLPSRDISIYSVGSDTKFAPLVALLQQFAIPWTVVCDGKVYGSAGRVRGSTIAEQLTEAGIAGVPALDGLDFAQRRDALEPLGVFSLATSFSDEIEKLPIFAQHKVEATREAGRSKARRGHYIAMARDCPAEIASLLEQIRQYLLKRGVTNA
jgi:predicted ATP-dependent endonuclease of OLD family